MENVLPSNIEIQYAETSEPLIENNEKKIKLKEYLEEKDEKFNQEFGKNETLNFSTTVKVKTNLLYHDGKMILEGQELTVIPIHLTNEMKRGVQLIGNPTRYERLFPILTLNFDLVTAKLTVTSKERKEFKIDVLGTPKVFEFQFPSTTPNELFIQLIRLIQSSISSSLGNSMNLFGVSMRKNFYQNYFVDYLKFLKWAKTGDVIIFRGNECPARCQRCFTQADYDHVGLFIKKEQGLFVFESTSKDGVKLRPWIEFVVYFWNLLYEKMVYRELIIELPEKEKIQENINKKVLEFVDLTQYKKYRLKGCGLCFAEVMKEYEKKNEWDKSKGFFCSQLVAGAYYMAGIMPYVSDTRAYLPGAFSRDGNLPLEKGFRLGPEYILEFSE